MNDLVMAAEVDGTLTSAEVLDALKAICGHHRPAPHIVAA